MKTILTIEERTVTITEKVPVEKTMAEAFLEQWNGDETAPPEEMLKMLHDYDAFLMDQTTALNCCPLCERTFRAREKKAPEPEEAATERLEKPIADGDAVGKGE